VRLRCELFPFFNVFILIIWQANKFKSAREEEKAQEEPRDRAAEEGKVQPKPHGEQSERDRQRRVSPGERDTPFEGIPTRLSRILWLSKKGTSASLRPGGPPDPKGTPGKEPDHSVGELPWTPRPSGRKEDTGIHPPPQRYFGEVPRYPNTSRTSEEGVLTNRAIPGSLFVCPECECSLPPVIP